MASGRTSSAAVITGALSSPRIVLQRRTPRRIIRIRADTDSANRAIRRAHVGCVSRAECLSEECVNDATCARCAAVLVRAHRVGACGMCAARLNFAKTQIEHARRMLGLLLVGTRRTSYTGLTNKSPVISFDVRERIASARREGQTRANRRNAEAPIFRASRCQ